MVKVQIAFANGDYREYLVREVTTSSYKQGFWTLYFHGDKNETMEIPMANVQWLRRETVPDAD